MTRHRGIRQPYRKANHIGAASIPWKTTGRPEKASYLPSGASATYRGATFHSQKNQTEPVSFSISSFTLQCLLTQSVVYSAAGAGRIISSTTIISADEAEVESEEEVLYRRATGWNTR